MGRPKLSKEEIIEQVEKLGLKFIKFKYYDGKDSRFIVQCKYNHEPYETNLNAINKKRKALGCPTCKSLNKSITNINKVSYESIVSECREFGYTVLTDKNEYKGISNPMKFMCENGHIEIIPYKILRKRKIKCSVCYHNELIKRAKIRANQLNYKLIGSEYINGILHLKLICSENHIWTPTYDSFVNKQAKCYYCNIKILANNQKLDWNEVKNRFALYGYQVLSNESDYINNQSKLLLRCTQGHECSISLSNFSRGRRCSICSQSNGEQQISYILNKYNIYYIRQYTFEDCRYKYPLRFDFYLPHINSVIEYDGRQHFESVDIFGGDEEFELTKIRDEIKNDYCKENGISLYRISYLDFNNIENIINGIIYKHCVDNVQRLSKPMLKYNIRK